MAPACRSVFGFLSGSRQARTLGTLDLGFGRSAAIWRNENDRITYDGAEGHTFSLYLDGGSGTRRVDGRPVSGRPAAFCVMPHLHRSEWEITAPFGFVHLYLPAEELRRTFAETFDRDARMLDVAEVTFADAPRLATVLRSIARAVETNEPLTAEAAMTEFIALFFDDARWGGLRRHALTGGLAPHVARRIVEHVEANLHETIRLADLATEAGLSAFHLQRSFRASRGVSPQTFIMHRRVERAKALLRGRDPIAAIAFACGFSSQSHLTRVFRAATGVTPGAYRHLACDGRSAHTAAS